MKYEPIEYQEFTGKVIECPECKRIMTKQEADYRGKCIHCGQKFKIEKE